MTLIRQLIATHCHSLGTEQGTWYTVISQVTLKIGQQHGLTSSPMRLSEEVIQQVKDAKVRQLDFVVLPVTAKPVADCTKVFSLPRQRQDRSTLCVVILTLI